MHKQKVLRIFAATLVVLLATNLSLSAQSAERVANAYNWSMKNYKNNIDGAIDSMNVVDTLSTKLLENGDLEGQLKEQIKQLQTKAHNYLPQFYMKSAYTLYKQMRTDMAIEKFKKTIKLGEKYGNKKVVKRSKSLLPKLYYKAGTEGMQMMDYQKAITMFDKATKYREDWAKAYMKQALAYKKAGNDAQMIKTINTTIEAAKKAGKQDIMKRAKRMGQTYYWQKGASSISKSKNEEALAAFKKALEFDENDSYSYYYITLAKNKLFKYSEALEDGKKALELLKPVEGDKEKEQQAKIHLQMGIALASLGKKEKGCEYLKKAEYGKSASKAQKEQDSFECAY